MALDMSMMVEQIYRDTGTLVRGLAHPAIFSSARAPRPGSRPASRANPFEAMVSEWGAVPVGARNFATLLARGESVLLFPGGAREACKLKGEAYALFWPDKGEFVRMAAKHGALIVPFAAVGCEDGLTQVLDTQELLALPGVGPWLADRAAAATPPARRGVSADPALEAPMLIPLAVPRGLPERYYYWFGAPVEPARDRDAADGVYKEVKQAVEGGIAWLLDKRQADAYRMGAPRLAYEAVAGGRRRRLTFE